MTPVPPDRPAPSPEPDPLRLAALRASWRRDRQVRRRRLAVRWLAWAFWRYGLAVLLVLATAAAVALGIGRTTHAAPPPPTSAAAPLSSEPLPSQRQEPRIHE